MGFFYKRCEVCGKDICKLQNLFSSNFENFLLWKNCGARYKIVKNIFYKATRFIVEIFAPIIFLLLSVVYNMVAWVFSDLLKIFGFLGMK